MRKRKPIELLGVIFIAFIFLGAFQTAETTSTQTILNVPAVYPTITAAMAVAVRGDTILVAAGTYAPYSENPEVFPIKMIDGVSLIGAGAGVSILDAAYTNRVIYCLSISDPTTKIDGFTITGGDAGGGRGGGICIRFSSLIISNNTISGNEAKQGGGISCYGTSNFVSSTIFNNTIEGNTADNPGGGIYCFDSYPRISDNIIRANNTEQGGGITLSYCYKAALPNLKTEIANNIITLNTADNLAGGIQIYSSRPNIINNTISGNSAPNYAGGIYSYHNSFPTIENCIIWDNGVDFYGEIVTFCCLSNLKPGTAGQGTIIADLNTPMFADDDYRLDGESPCIDTGNNAILPDWLTTDFEGDARRIDGDNDEIVIVDIGADEYCDTTDVIMASVDIDPDTLNLKSEGKWITVYIELPVSHDVAEIGMDSISIDGAVFAELKPSSTGDYDDDGVLDLMVKFARSGVKDYIINTLGVTDEKVTLMITGEVGQDSTPFQGEDTIRVIKKGK